MERPEITQYFPKETTIGDVLVVYKNNQNLFQYAEALDLYIDNLEKQRDELIGCLKLAYENLNGYAFENVFSKIEEILTKTKHNE